MPNMIQERGLHASCLLTDGTLWISGGWHKGRKSSEILKVGLSEFSHYVDLPESMRYHNMLAVNRSAVIFVGNEPASRKVFMFDVTEERFAELPDMESERIAPQAGQLNKLRSLGRSTAKVNN